MSVCRQSDRGASSFPSSCRRFIGKRCWRIAPVGPSHRAIRGSARRARWNCFGNSRLNRGANAEGCRHAPSDISRRTPLQTLRSSRRPLVNRSGHRYSRRHPAGGLHLRHRGHFGSLSGTHRAANRCLSSRRGAKPRWRGPPTASPHQAPKGGGGGLKAVPDG